MANEPQLEFFDKPEARNPTDFEGPGFTLFPPHFDAAGNFIHPCGICGKPAYQGRDVCLRRGNLGSWRCYEHEEVPPKG